MRKMCAVAYIAPSKHFGTGDLGPNKLGSWSDCLQTVEVPDGWSSGDLIRIVDGKPVRVENDQIYRIFPLPESMRDE